MSLKKVYNFCFTKRGGTIIAILMVIMFFILSLLRTYSYQSFADVVNDKGNDWGTYAQYALDIKQDGLLMPSLLCPYAGPSAFLYNYFIALCLVLFGERLLPILVLQHLMLGLSIAITYWTFRDRMKNLTALGLLLALFLFGLLDVYKYYSAILLSENLALFTITLFFFFFMKGFEKDNRVFQICASILLGLSILIRPNLVIFAICLIPLAWLLYFRNKRNGSLIFALFVFALIASSSLLLIRNYMVCKKPFFFSGIIHLAYFKIYNSVPPSLDIYNASNLVYAKAYLQYAIQSPVAFFKVYVDKVLFCFGFLPILCSAYRLRPHWMIMWVGYFIYLFLRIKEHKKLELWEACAHLYIFCYYGSLIMSTAIHNYGFRMLILGTNIVLVFQFMALDKIGQMIKVSHKVDLRIDS